MRYGIDVSHWQGNIDWSKVKASGKQFAILKCMYESSFRPDETFEKNYEGCVKNGIDVGIYLYHARKSFENPTLEANSALNILKGRNLPYGIWLDLEDKNIRGKSKSEMNKFIQTEASIFKAKGYNVGIYCNKDWYYNVLDSSTLKKTYHFWVARYPSQDNGTVQESLSPKSYASGWQYSSKGRVNGISGNVDLDIDYGNMAVTLSGGSGATLKGDIRIVTADHLNARLDPNNGAILSTYEKGDKVYVVEEKNGWCKVQSWVSSGHLKK